MKVGDLVKYRRDDDMPLIRKPALGIVLGFHTSHIVNVRMMLSNLDHKFLKKDLQVLT